jgi:hypothetical protein
MMQTLRRYRALTADNRSLVLEAALATVMVRLGISAIQFTALQKTLDTGVRVFARERSNGITDEVKRVAWSVAAVTQRLPFRCTCLVQSLAVDAMLRRRGVSSEIRVGVRPPGSGTLVAHAWVEHHGEVVFGARGDLADYRALARRGAR